jgi:hypothetical protein
MASPPLRGSAEWSAKREVAVLLGLTRGNHYAAQQLWLQRERHKAEASQIASAGSPQASQQAAGCQAKPATAGARDVPRAKPKKSAARLAKDQRRLNQKHLASKMWAYVRVASRLRAWSVRARAASRACFGLGASGELDGFVECAASLGLRAAVSATVAYDGGLAPPWPATGPLRRSPILVGRLLVQQWPSRRAAAGLPPAPAPLALAAPPPATQLAPSTPPSQQPPSRPVWNGGPLAAAATTTAPAASRPKRDVPAASPSRAPAAPKKTRGAAVQAALAAAAPPITAENYAAHALAAANPHPPSA